MKKCIIIQMNIKLTYSGINYYWKDVIISETFLWSTTSLKDYFEICCNLIENEYKIFQSQIYQNVSVSKRNLYKNHHHLPKLIQMHFASSSYNLNIQYKDKQ